MKFKWPEVLPYNWELFEKDGLEGRFWVVSKTTSVIASCLEYDDKNYWVHLSVARKTEMPSFELLKKIKEFVIGDRWAVQVFPPSGEYVNIHPYCLHLYAPADENYRPLPDFRIMGQI